VKFAVDPRLYPGSVEPPGEECEFFDGNGKLIDENWIQFVDTELGLVEVVDWIVEGKQVQTVLKNQTTGEIKPIRHQDRFNEDGTAKTCPIGWEEVPLTKTLRFKPPINVVAKVPLTPKDRADQRRKEAKKRQERLKNWRKK
jgi:hypothetical protein